MSYCVVCALCRIPKEKYFPVPGVDGALVTFKLLPPAQRMQVPDERGFVSTVSPCLIQPTGCVGRLRLERTSSGQCKPQGHMQASSCAVAHTRRCLTSFRGCSRVGMQRLCCACTRSRQFHAALCGSGMWCMHLLTWLCLMCVLAGEEGLFRAPEDAAQHAAAAVHSTTGELHTSWTNANADAGKACRGVLAQGCAAHHPACTGTFPTRLRAHQLWV